MPGILSGLGNLAGGKLGGWAMRTGGLGSRALMAGASGAFRYAGMGAVGQRAIAGAALGGAYGALSSDTSVLGGMAMGAGIGAASVGAGRGITAYRDLRGMGRGRTRAAAGALNLMGLDARNFIGNTMTKASNAFKAMGR
jgi:hypothetical protein